MIRLYRYGSRRYLLTVVIGLFATFNLFSYLYYVSPRLDKTYSHVNIPKKIHDQNNLLEDDIREPSFIVGNVMNESPEDEGKVSENEVVSNEEVFLAQDLNWDPEQVTTEELPSIVEELDKPVVKSNKLVSEKTGLDVQSEIDKQFKFLHNPWFTLPGQDSDPLGSDPKMYNNKTVDGCSFRNYNNYTLFAVPEFVTDFVKFKDCTRGKGTPVNNWLNEKLTATIGDKGQLVLDTSRMNYDLDKIDVCAHSEPKILFLVLSHSSDQEKRKTIRDTWGSEMGTNNEEFRLIFITGRDRNELEEENEALIKESELHDDLIVTCVDESEVDFGTKQILATLMWIYERCQMARFVTFTSADTFINIKRFQLLIEKEMYAANRIYGSLMKRMQPNRDPSSPHFISERDWPWVYFPPFVNEPTFIVSSDLVPRLLLAATALDLIPLEQVYITGMASLMARAMRIDVANFFGSEVPSETPNLYEKIQNGKSLNDSEICLYANRGALHKVASRDEMMSLVTIYEDVNKKNITCNETPKCLAMVEGKCILFSKKNKVAKENSEKTNDTISTTTKQ